MSKATLTGETTSSNMTTTATNKYAIIGMGCRFPGDAKNPNEFFDNLLQGKNCITEVPPDRWKKDYYYDPENGIGKTYTKYGGFVNEFPFDHRLYNMSSTEAKEIDPQQRILLKVAMDALHDSGIKYRGTKMGVFVGAGALDFGYTSSYSDHHVSKHTIVGNLLALIANRVSYAFNLRGSSMVVDTACAASGTALHNACLHIAQNECSTALVAGVNIILNPAGATSFSKLGVISPDGQCKSFDSSANGYVRSEGCGVVIIKKLEDAIRDNNRIYCIIRATSSNTDGATSPSLTMPSAIAQKELLTEALRKANVPASEIAYAEAHATGTNVGDPIEANVIGQVYGTAHSQECKLKIGSVKSNIGHLEPGAFIAGLIKCAMIMYRGVIAPNRNFKNPNPNIHFDKYNMEVVREQCPLQGNYISVSSFGIGGSNVCAILERYTPDSCAMFPTMQKQMESINPEQSPNQRNTNLYLIPSHTKNSLEQQVEHVIQWHKETSNVSESERVVSINKRANIHNSNHLCYITGKSLQDAAMVKKYMTFSELKTSPKKCFVFSGQGTQHEKMGMELFENVSSFRDAVEKCDKLYKNISGISLIDDLGLFKKKVNAHQNGGSVDNDLSLKHVKFTLPALFFMQVGLYEMWISMGVKPDAVMGHSFGEMCALYSLGYITLEQAISLVYHRADVMQRYGSDANNGMMAVGQGEEKVQEVIKQLNLKQTSISAINSPKSVTVGGSKAELKLLAGFYKEKQVFYRELQVTNAFHTSFMTPLQKPCMEAFDSVISRGTKLKKSESKANIEFISTVWGKFVQPEHTINTEYMWQNIQDPVRFCDAIKCANEKFGEECLFFELSAHPALVRSIEQCGGKYVLSCQQRDKDGNEMFSEAIAKLTSFRISLNWESIMGCTDRNVPSPYRYAQLESQYTLDNPVLEDKHSPEKFGAIAGRKLTTSPGCIYHNLINTKNLTWLSDHKVQGVVIYPVAALTEAMLEVAGDGVSVLHNLQFKFPLTIPEDESYVNISTEVFHKDNQKGLIKIHAKSKNDKSKNDKSKNDNSNGDIPDNNGWLLCAEGSFDKESKRLSRNYDLQQLEYTNWEKLQKEDIYNRFSFNDLTYGDRFKTIQEAYIDTEREMSVTCIDLTQEKNPVQDKARNLIIHPVILDGIIQSFITAIPSVAYTYLPASISSVEIALNEDLPEKLFVVTELKHANITSFSIGDDPSNFFVTGDIYACDIHGKVYLHIKELSCLRMNFRSLPAKGLDLFHTTWKKVDYHEEKEETVAGTDGETFVSEPTYVKEMYEKTVAGTDAETFVIEPTSVKEMYEKCKEIKDSHKRIVVITTNGQCVTQKERPNPDMYAIIAFGRVLANENEGKDVFLIDMDNTTSDRDTWKKRSEKWTRDKYDTEIAIRDDVMYIPRLDYLKTSDEVKSNFEEASKKNIFSDKKTYVVSGGLGGIGFELILMMLKYGAKHVLVLSRSCDTKKRQSKELQKWKELGKNIVIKKIQISNKEEVTQMYEESHLKELGLPPAIGGILHLAGYTSDVPIQNMNEEHLKVMSPKIEGTKNLVRLLKDRSSLEFVALFSSITPVVGNTEQANYAAANAYMDSFAKRQREKDLPIFSINVTPVIDVGILANQVKTRKIMDARGFPAWVDVSGVFKVLVTAILMKNQTEFVMRTDFEKNAQIFKTVRDLTSLICDHNAANKEINVSNVGDARKCLEDGIAKLLKVEHIEGDQNLTTYGVDSLAAVEISSLIMKNFNTQVSQLAILNGISMDQLFAKIGSK